MYKLLNIICMDSLSSQSHQSEVNQRFSVRKKIKKESPQPAQAESEVVGGEIIDIPEVSVESQVSGSDTTNEVDEKAKEKVGERLREESYTKADIALRKLLIEAGAADAVLSGAEATALARKMQDAIAEVSFDDGIFVDEMKKKGEYFIDTKRTAEIVTNTGDKAVFKVMLKIGMGEVPTAEFKLQGDGSKSGQYAEKLMNS